MRLLRGELEDFAAFRAFFKLAANAFFSLLVAGKTILSVKMSPAVTAIDIWRSERGKIRTGFVLSLAR